MNHYEITETIYDEIKQSFDARNTTSQFNKQEMIARNFALPPNKAVKVWQKERAYRNRSKERENIENKKDVTLYVGAVDFQSPRSDDMSGMDYLSPSKTEN